ncbi:MAG: ABC transporter ATP-binding protein, partial [Bacilli bacterium]
RNRNVGMVFQSYALFPNLTVAENIAYGLKVQGVKREERQALVKEMIALVHLEGKEKMYPEQLSGGQQQRVALARSLVVRPKVLLLDEPLGALDAQIRRNLQTELRSIQRKLGMTMIFVTHDQDEAMIMSDRIIVINNGKIEQIGTPEEVYTSPRTHFVASFMGSYNVLSENTSLGFTSAIGIRPEVITFSNEVVESEDTYSLPGKVLDVTIHGTIVRYRVQTNEEELFVDTLFNGAVKKRMGDEVILTIPRKQMIPLY